MSTKFGELHLHPAIASALAARGYDTATPVQAAVLAADQERDLLVSSQTGSGKTIAFGTALAATVLGEQPKIAHGPAPVALVIVPTRELAAQVCEELRWLLHGTGIRLASVTGGTPIVGDLKTLQRGVELVIGTPGRLVDLLRRSRLQLAALKAVVLDEADEMLDLGFREDLETILQAAPATRRTLLLSATLPPEIRALAKRYQRDALPVDARAPREGGAAHGAGAHEDIAYRAHLVAGHDRLAAVVNVLRADASARAIVFCTTREGVSQMHEALTARGFAAAAISGERAQAERDRALEQLRRGDAQVLVATNVAARGLHLPDVDLIVHADLPLNADSLIHRSGRTGRAGRKGAAVLIASVAERRKAERLLDTANIKATWTPPPDAGTIAAAAEARFVDEIVAAPPPDEGDAASALLATIEERIPARELARRLLARELGRLPVGERIQPVAIAAATPDRHPQSGPRRSRSDFSHEGTLFRINIGAKDKADPRWLLPLICRRGGVTRRDVGAIRIGPHETTFEIAGDAAADFALASSAPDPRALHVRITRGHAPQAPQGRGGPYAPQGRGGPHAPHAPRAPHAPQAPHAQHVPHAPKDGSAPHVPRAPKDGSAPPTRRQHAHRLPGKGPRGSSGHRR
jgi:ATP-dependent RNA helicase DeaD